MTLCDEAMQCRDTMRSMMGDCSEEIARAAAAAKAEPFQADNRRSYRRDTLRRGAQGEVAYMEWPAGAGVDYHGHSEAAVLLRVLDGEFIEERWIFDGVEYAYELATVRAGEESFLPIGSYHRIKCSKGARSIHVFNPLPTSPTSPVPEEVWPALIAAREWALEPALDYVI